MMLASLLSNNYLKCEKNLQNVRKYRYLLHDMQRELLHELKFQDLLYD